MIILQPKDGQSEKMDYLVAVAAVTASNFRFKSSQTGNSLSLSPPQTSKQSHIYHLVQASKA